MDESKDTFVKVGGALIGREQKEDSCETHGPFTSEGYKLPRGTHWTKCPACAEIEMKQQEEETKKRIAEDAQRRLEARMKHAGIPYRFRGKDFATYIADTDGKEKAKASAMEFATNFEDHYKRGTVMVFSGMPGTGKSHLAIAIAQSIMARHTALYTSAIDAVRMVRDTWRKDSEKTESQVLDELAFIDLLILDEVGVQYGSDAEQITLFDIIDKRYRNMMPIILLTNQNRKGMKEFLGDRSFDRLREGGIWVTFDWQSQRSEQNYEKIADDQEKPFERRSSKPKDIIY